MTTPTLDPHQTIAQLVLEHSACAAVFQRHRIDFCCGGDVSLASAAEARTLDLEGLVAELSRAIATGPGAGAVDPRTFSTPRLVAHIVAVHHEYLRQNLPFLRELAAKVSRVHGEHNPKLRDLGATVQTLTDALLAHLDEEENVLFPALTAPSAGPGAAAPMLGAMVEEHLEVARLLERVRAASDDFSLPDWACNSYRTLFAELARLESDIFTHVHLENHVLRPRFAAA